jgi:CheY-like chemotaxis protein
MARILLVEDNELNRDMLAERLELRGYQILTAADGVQAVTMAHSEKPDAILMDMSLPVLDGWEATRQLKAAPDTCAIPIIALTAHVMAGDRDRCLEAGCDAYEGKPIDFPQLLAKLQSLLDKSSTP